jgi:hypothetical protein
MITVMCVLKSGGIYDASWVRKLRDGVARHCGIVHRFMCLTDVPVDCEMLKLQYDFPGWWSKLELFRPGVIDGPTLYLDLDNLVIGDIAALVPQPHEFAMIRNFNRPAHVSSCVMWFKEAAPVRVWEKFIAEPERWMKQYAVKQRDGAVFGDQAFVWDALDRAAPIMDFPRALVPHYRKDLMQSGRRPENAAVVIFSGSIKPSTVKEPWVSHAWA